MILAFSTSGPAAGIAYLQDDGAVLWKAHEEARRNAGAVCAKLLNDAKTAGFKPQDCNLFLADLGPGSFTGVRVGVTFAKTLAFACGGMTGGASSFDLISLDQTVMISSRRNEYLIREVGKEPYRAAEEPPGGAIGYFLEGRTEVTPEAWRFALLIGKIEPVAPELLLPAYLIEPSISTPKKPFSRVDEH